MTNIDILIRHYTSFENVLKDLLSKIVIDDNNFEQLPVVDAALIYTIVPTIESMAKGLHKELSSQFPDLPQFKKPNESFDYCALGFLDQAIGLSTKQVKITSKQLLLSEEQRLLTPLQGAHEQDKSKHPKWSLIYQSYKHDQANTQSSDSELRPTYELPQTYVCGFTVFPLPFFSSIPLSDLLM